MSDSVEYKLPAKWVRVNLSDIATINPPLDRCVVSDDVPVDFVPMRAVEPEGGGLLRPEVASYGEVKKGYTAFLPGDVITAKITPCMENGKTCVVPPLPGAACFGSTEFHVLRAEPGVGARWIANYLLQHSTRRAAQRQMAGGVGQMRVPAVFLETLVLPVPPEPEQVRILDTLDELLSDLNAGVAALERVRAKLKHYRAAVLKAAVEGALTAEWRRQHPATETAYALLTRILAERRRRWEEAQLAKFEAAGKAPPKDWKARYVEPVAPPQSLPVLPAGWSWVTMDQLLWQLRSGSSESSSRTATEFPVLRSSAVRPGRINLADRNYLSAEQSWRSENFLERDDVLITRLSGSVEYVGCCAIVGDLEGKRIQYPDRIFCCKSVKSLSGTYLTYAMQHPRVRRDLEKAAKSTAGHKRISISDLLPLAVPVPPENEQDAIADAVESQLSVIDHLDSELERKLASSVALRQSILSQALSGQLVPQDPSDEPASKLLKRIAAEREERSRLLGAAKQAKPKTKAPRRRATKE